MSQDTAKPTVDTAYWRQYVEKALAEQLGRADIAHEPATKAGPNEVHTAFRIEQKAIHEQVDSLYMRPVAEALIAELQKAGKKRVAMMLDVQDVAGYPGVAIRLFPQD